MTTPTSSPVHGSIHAASPWVTRWTHVIAAGGKVLDLACGTGRHTRHLAAHGFEVEAVDRDQAALDALSHAPGVISLCADLEGGPWPFVGRQFDGVVVTNYLHRPLMPAIAAILAPGGVLIYETFRLGNESYGKPSNPAFLLQPGELRLFADAAGLQVVAFEDGFCAYPKPAMIQRLCAVKPPFRSSEQARLE